MHQKVINKFLIELDLFINSNLRNHWIYLDELKIYVRKSKRYHNYTPVNCLDLATIEVYKTGNGLFTELLKEILKKYNHNIFIESILEQRFYDFLLEFGFEPYSTYQSDLIFITNKK